MRALAILLLSSLGCTAPPAPEPPSPAPGAPAPAPSGPGQSAASASAEPTADDERIAAIEKAINDTEAMQHRCWEYAAADNYHVTGRLVLALTFGQSDTATVAVKSDEPGDERLTTCLTQLFEAYRWPRGVFEPGMVIDLPFAFKAPRYQYTVRRQYVEPHVLAGGKLTASVLLDEENSGNGAGALSLLEISGKLKVGLHRHTSAEVLYVISGQGRVFGLDGVERGTRVGPGHAIYIAAGTAHGFVHAGAEPIVLCQLYAPSGPEKRFKGGPAVGTTPVSKQEIRRPPKAFPKPLVVKKPKVYQLGGGAIEIAIYFDESITGDKAAYLGFITARPDARVPPHRHPGSTEMLLALAGENVTTIAGDPYAVGPMTALQIPAGVEHSLDGRGHAAIEAIQFYTPAGPEQRFKKAPVK